MAAAFEHSYSIKVIDKSQQVGTAPYIADARDNDWDSKFMVSVLAAPLLAHRRQK